MCTHPTGTASAVVSTPEQYIQLVQAGSAHLLCRLYPMCFCSIKAKPLQLCMLPFLLLLKPLFLCIGILLTFCPFPSLQAAMSESRPL